MEDIHYIERGYENFVGKLRALGADIALVNDPDELKSSTRTSAPADADNGIRQRLDG